MVPKLLIQQKVLTHHIWGIAWWDVSGNGFCDVMQTCILFEALCLICNL